MIYLITFEFMYSVSIDDCPFLMNTFLHFFTVNLLIVKTF